MVVVIDSSAPGRVARFRPAWRKCMAMTRRPTSTIGFIGLQATSTIGYIAPQVRDLTAVMELVNQQNAQKIRDCSRATGFIQLVYGEVMQGFVDGLRLALPATYPGPDAHGSARASARGRHSFASCDSAGCPVPRHWMSKAVTCRQEM